jgi:hypothetical protein
VVQVHVTPHKHSFISHDTYKPVSPAGAVGALAA